MNQNIEFENHFSARVLEILFPDGYKIKSEEDIAKLKNAWSAQLKSWHSPYTCLFDLRNFEIDESFIPQFEALIKFFKNFFMKKIIGFYEEGGNVPTVTFEVHCGYEKAISLTGLARGKGSIKKLGDLRSLIVIDNDFNAHVMEINFDQEVFFNTKEDIGILKSKLQNILMMWHTPYSILFNCINCTFSPEAKEEFAKVERFLKGFFCKKIAGYAPKNDKDSYPFEVFRSRHLAAGSLDNSGLESGEVANCSTRKIGT